MSGVPTPTPEEERAAAIRYAVFSSLEKWGMEVNVAAFEDALAESGLAVAPINPRGRVTVHAYRAPPGGTV